jgi:hypothetical protein
MFFRIIKSFADLVSNIDPVNLTASYLTGKNIALTAQLMNLKQPRINGISDTGNEFVVFSKNNVPNEPRNQRASISITEEAIKASNGMFALVMNDNWFM